MSNQVHSMERLIAGLCDQLLFSGHVFGGYEPSTYFERSEEGEIMALAFQIQIDVNNYGYSKNDGNLKVMEEQRARRTVMVIISEHKHVFINPDVGFDCWNVRHLTDHPELLEWFQNTSNHSSCWRSDGLRMINELAWKAYEEAYGNMPEEHMPCFNDSNIDLDLHFGICGNVFEYCAIKHKADPKDFQGHGGYKRLLTNVRRVRTKVFLLDDKKETSV